MNVIATEKEQKGVCQCRSCNGFFNQSEIKRVNREHLGQTVITTTCPYCGSSTFGLVNSKINQLVDEEYNTYKKWNVKNISKNEMLAKYDLNDEQELEFYTHGFLIR